MGCALPKLNCVGGATAATAADRIANRYADSELTPAALKDVGAVPGACHPFGHDLVRS